MKNKIFIGFCWILSFGFVQNLVAQKAKSVFLTDEVDITFYATSDTSTVNAARGLAMLKLDFDRGLLDSFFYFQRQYQPVATLLNDATVWQSGLYVSNKFAIQCAKEWFLRSYHYQNFTFEIEKQQAAKNPNLANALRHLRDQYFGNGLGSRLVLETLPASWHGTGNHNLTALVEHLTKLEGGLRARANADAAIRDSLLTVNLAHINPPAPPAQFQTERTGGGALTLLSEQSLWWGVSSFVAERFKIELQLAFFERMQQRLNETNAHLLFPETARLLRIDSLSEKISSVRHTPNISTSFQVAIETDLLKLNENLILSLQNPRFLATISNKNPEVEAKLRYLEGSLSFLQLLRKGKNPLEALEETAISYPNIMQSEFDSHINFVHLLMQNIQKTQKNAQVFLSENDFKHLLKEPMTPRYFVALLFHQNEAVFNAIGWGSDVLRVRGEAVLRPIGGLVKSIQRGSELTELVKTSGSEQTLEVYIDYLSSLVEALEETARLSKNWQNNQPSTGFSQWIGIYKSIGNMARAAKEKNYAVTLNNTLGILDQLATIADPDVRENIQKLTATVGFYGAFGCDLLRSKTDKDVKHVVNNYALPVGSYRHKRLWGRNLHLNAYAGGFLGRETLDWAQNQPQNGGGTVVSFSAPIGFDYSWKPSGKTDLGAQSVFLSVIDLGAVVSYQIGGGATYPQPALKLENILAPGLTYFWHLPRKPISLGATIQMAPRLRNLTADNATLTANRAWRAGISATVDIPIFRFSSF